MAREERRERREERGSSEKERGNHRSQDNDSLTLTQPFPFCCCLHCAHNTRIRIEGLLAAFPKLIGAVKQHTYSRPTLLPLLLLLFSAPRSHAHPRVSAWR
eukprot:3390593-Rhodomonas_salina.1